jgi:hypothetical protein
MNEVQFTSSKALYFEEFDYTAGQGTKALYYAQAGARINVQFFDSSVRRITTGTPTQQNIGGQIRFSGNQANPGWDPSDINNPEPAQLEYQSIDTRYFPDLSGNQAQGGQTVTPTASTAGPAAASSASTSAATRSTPRTGKSTGSESNQNPITQRPAHPGVVCAPQAPEFRVCRS